MGQRARTVARRPVHDHSAGPQACPARNSPSTTLAGHTLWGTKWGANMHRHLTPSSPNEHHNCACDQAVSHAGRWPATDPDPLRIEGDRGSNPLSSTRVSPGQSYLRSPADGSPWGDVRFWEPKWEPILTGSRS